MVPSIAIHRLDPGAVLAWLEGIEKLAKDAARVTHDGDIHAHVLANLGGVDIDMDDASIRGEARGVSGGAVIEARADCQDQIRMLHRLVRGVVAIHPEHPGEERVGAGEASQAKECAHDGEIRALRERSSFFARSGSDDAAPDIEQRALCLCQRLGGPADLHRMAVEGRPVTNAIHGRRAPVFAACLQHAGGDVEKHGARAPGAGHVECLGHGPSMRSTLETRPLCLVIERVMPVISASWKASVPMASISTWQVIAQRDRVHLRGRDAGDQVGGAWAGCREADADSPLARA